MIQLTTEFKSELWHNALPIGKFYHPAYGEVEITKDLITKMAENFKKGIPHYKPPVNISHNDEQGAYGFVEDVEARDDGLWVKLVLTDEGLKLLEARKFNYLSAEFATNYIDPKTGEEVGPVFLGVALTNRPAHPEMKPLSLSHLITAIKDAITLAFEKVFGNSEEYIELEDYSKWPKDEDSPWDWDWARDANAIIEKFGWKGLARVCAYVKKENGKLPEKKEAYKLPFAKLKNGKLTIYRRGVIAAMQALLGARGGVDIPRDEKKKVYNKLARLYRLFNMEPPEFHYEEEVSSVELQQKVEELQKLLEEKEKQIEELQNKLKEYELEAFKTKKVAEGYKPAVVEKILEMVKKGAITLEAAEEMISLTEKIDFEQKYELEVITKPDVSKMALEDAKKLGFVKGGEDA